MQQHAFERNLHHAQRLQLKCPAICTANKILTPKQVVFELLARAVTTVAGPSNAELRQPSCSKFVSAFTAVTGTPGAAAFV